jgi:outer membrane receptor protein involved in Fe transport
MFHCLQICSKRLTGLFLMLMLPLMAMAQQGRLTGVIRDHKNETLPGVTVRIEGTTEGTVTQLDGTYNIQLATGSYTVTFSYQGESRKVTDVIIKSGEVTDLNMTINPESSKTLSEVRVVGFKQATVEGLYNKQRNNAAISDGISADQIRRTPDNNAAQVLRRVSGLTVQDNKFVTVRGMSERYNNVMLNNSSLPSTEPNRRNFSFDIIPSNLIDNIVVSKTATPDMPGEFAGGMVQVQTKDIPASNYVNLSIGSGYNTMSIGQPMQSLKRTQSHFFTAVPSHRDWWDGRWNDNEYKEYVNTANFKKVSKYNQKIPNNWGLYQYDYNPLQQYQAVLGHVFKLNETRKIGVVAALTYRHDEYVTDEAARFRISDYLLYGKSYDLNTTLAGILNLAYQTNTSRISFRNLYNNKYGQTTQVYNGSLLSGGSAIFSYNDVITSNALYQNKLEGEHTVGSKKIKLGWSVDRSQLTRLQPDMRSSIVEKGFYGISEAQGSFSISGGGLSVMNAKLKEERYNYSAYVSAPFRAFGYDQKLKLGYQGMSRNADFIFSGLKLLVTPKSNVQDEIFNRPDYFLGDRKYLRPDGLYYKPAGPSFSSDPEAYTGTQSLNAAYLMGDLKLTDKLRFIGGVRYEMNNMKVNTITYTFNSNSELVIKNETLTFKSNDLLPSFNLVYSLNDRMNLRAAYSKTLARPDFRERSAFMYYDFSEFTPYRGISGLQDTKIDNADLRYEFYPNPGEVLSVSLFYKKFKNPVELVQEVSSGSTSAVNFYFNLESSTNYGIEADWRKSLAMFAPESRFLQKIFISGNFSYMRSQVNYDIGRLVAASSGLNPDSVTSADKNRQRPLQGLSPYIINGGLGYQGKLIGLQVSYNRFGPRLVTGAPFAYQDQYEQSRDVLDVQFTVRALKNKMDIRINVSDLLQQPFIIYQNAGSTTDLQGEISDNQDPNGTRYNKNLDVVRQKYYRGSNVSFTISYQL